MSWLSKIFGGDVEAKSTAAGVEYEGYTIFAEPIAEGKSYRIAARITRSVDGEIKEHRLIRADTLTERDAAVDASIAKARQVIDQQGTRIFD